jgi:hypothetical protein
MVAPSPSVKGGNIMHTDRTISTNHIHIHTNIFEMQRPLDFQTQLSVIGLLRLYNIICILLLGYVGPRTWL